MIPGDQIRVSMRVRVPRERAFRLFTEQIDQWWQKGPRFRMGPVTSVLHLEARPGGRLFETVGDDVVAHTGTITEWAPPERFVLRWRAVNFADEDESTVVEVSFAEQGAATLVTVVHRGWARIRHDHPVRHGQAPRPFIARMGRWWADLLTALRELAEAPTDPA